MKVSTVKLPDLLSTVMMSGITPMVKGPPAIGKALANRERVLTPSGFQRIGRLKERQWVIGSNGKPTQITGVFPQSGKRPIYEVICKDGSAILCDAEHKWTVNNRDWKKSKIKTTQELMDAGLYNLERDIKRNTTNRRYKFSLPATPACEFNVNAEISYEIDPYLLGLLLGDGSLSRPNVIFTNAHEALIDKVETLLPAHSCVGHKEFRNGAWHISIKNNLANLLFNAITIKGNAFKKDLAAIGIGNCKSVDKAIPYDYLHGSLQTRQAIYQGLIDTDGYVLKGKVHEYSTSSKQLANDFLFLARSIGKNFSISERESGYTKDGEFHQCGTSYRLHEFTNQPKLIKEINYIGEENATCISVAAEDNLFIAGDFNLTHNSDIIRQVAKKFNLSVIDLRLSQCDITDLNGFPSLNQDKTKSTFVPMDTFPMEGDEVPKGYEGWLLFLDEMNSASMSVQAAAFKLVLDRAVGLKKLHQKVAIICAGNRDIDKAIVNRLSTPMQSRLSHFELSVDHKGWLLWAAENKIDHRIMSFVSWKPEMLYNFKPDHNKDTYASPRTWEFCSRLIKDNNSLNTSDIPLIASVIDEAAAREFISYVRVFASLITIPQIIADPHGIDVPVEPSTQYALCGKIGAEMAESTVVPLMTFLKRMGAEFQIMSLQRVLKRSPTLIAHPAIKTWIETYSQELF